MHWTLKMPPQVPAGLRRVGVGSVLGLEDALFLIVLPFHTQYRLCLPEELLPVAISSVWVRDPRAEYWGCWDTRVWALARRVLKV